MPKQIAPEGWNNWGNPENEKTVFYAEYKNTGKGADFSQRIKWSKQLTEKEAKEYTVENIFFTTNSTITTGSDWFLKIRSKPFEWPLKQIK
jgi:pectinesterase